MAGRQISAATLRRIHATLRAALNEAVRVGLILANPAVGVELPSAPRPVRRCGLRSVCWPGSGTAHVRR